MKKIVKALSFVLFPALLLVSCAEQYTEITLDEAKELLAANYEKEAPYASATMTIEYTKVDVKVPQEILDEMHVTQEQFLGTLLGTGVLPQEGDTQTREIGTAELEYYRIDADSISEHLAYVASFYTSNEKLRITYTEEMKEKGKTEIVSQDKFINEFGYIESSKDSYEITTGFMDYEAYIGIEVYTTIEYIEA